LQIQYKTLKGLRGWLKSPKKTRMLEGKEQKVVEGRAVEGRKKVWSLD